MPPDPSRIHITICGDGGCGKSSITLRLVRSQWTSEYDPTIEDSYTISRTIDGKSYQLSLTDTAGQEEYRGMWGGSNMASDAFLMVYDITSMASLEALQYFNELVDMESETRQDHNAAILDQIKQSQKQSKKSRTQGSNVNNLAQEIRPLPVKITAGNKCDLQQSRQVDAKTGLEWSRRRGCGFMETSARNVVNIEETFALIVRRVVEARRQAADLAQDTQPGAAQLGAPGGGLSSNATGRGLPPQGLSFDIRADGGNNSIGGGGGHGRMGSGQSGGQNQRLGTSRAATAPLSPLPVGGEEKPLQLGQASQNTKWNKFWRKLRCW